LSSAYAQLANQDLAMFVLPGAEPIIGLSQSQRVERQAHLRCRREFTSCSGSSHAAADSKAWANRRTD